MSQKAYTGSIPHFMCPEKSWRKDDINIKDRQQLAGVICVFPILLLNFFLYSISSLYQIKAYIMHQRTRYLPSKQILMFERCTAPAHIMSFFYFYARKLFWSYNF